VTIYGREERRMEQTDKGAAFAEVEAPGIDGRAAELSWARPTRHKVAWWAFALLAVSAAALLLYAYPAFAQAGGDIDTCGQGGGVGGEGGQKILNGIRNLALFAAAGVGSISVLGLIASAAMVIIGSTSKDWQRRGFTGLALCGVGIFVALGAAAIYGLINWAICGG
jgi:hypothetical protein